MIIKDKHINSLLILVSVVCLLFANNKAYTQQAYAKVDTNSIRIGEQINMQVSVTVPKSTKLLWYAISDTISKNIEVINSQPIDTLKTENDKFVNYTQNITITSFDTGVHVIPPFAVKMQNDSNINSFAEIFTQPIPIQVFSVSVDTTKAIKDIKPIMRAPVTFREVIPYVLIAIGVVALVLLVIYLVNRIKKDKPILPIKRKPQLPAWEIALNELEKLRNKRLTEQNKIKTYYTELVDIFRQYLKNRFDIDAMEMLSHQIIDSCADLEIDSNLTDKVNTLLNTSDLVKFAKVLPSETENANSFNTVKQFVLETKPKQLENNTDNDTDNDNTNTENTQ
ncbi:MAG: hypothetical protein WBH98_07795 [Bacteroidales bacterium]